MRKWLKLKTINVHRINEEKCQKIFIRFTCHGRKKYKGVVEAQIERDNWAIKRKRKRGKTIIRMKNNFSCLRKCDILYAVLSSNEVWVQYKKCKCHNNNNNNNCIQCRDKSKMFRARRVGVKQTTTQKIALKIILLTYSGCNRQIKYFHSMPDFSLRTLFIYFSMSLFFLSPSFQYFICLVYIEYHTNRNTFFFAALCK